jgi:cephalosporin hydroxylase
MNPVEAFSQETLQNIKGLGQDKDAQALSRIWERITDQYKYTYNFEWLGRPIIQYPQDIIAMQEIIFEVKPDVIIETGIAHGGSLIFYASMLELVAACGGTDGEVLGIDIDIRAHNRKAIEEHPMFKRITMIEGSSISPEIITEV